MRPIDTSHSSVRWAAVGVACGAVGPAAALALRVAQLGWPGALSIFAADPLCWALATAPLGVGLVAWVGGRHHDTARALGRDLERRLALRTAALDAALAHQRLLLDSIGEAVLAVGTNGHGQGEPSTTAVRWFGAPALGPVSPWLFAGDLDQALSFVLGLSQLRDDLLPEALAFAQLPRVFRREGRRFEIGYRRIDAHTLLLVIRDTTATEAAQRAERERADQTALLTRIVRDPSGYRRFHAEATELVRSLEARLPPAEQARALHTLKGIAAAVGLSGLSSTCDAIEAAVAEQGTFAAPHLRTLQAAWRDTEAMASRYRSLFAEDRADNPASNAPAPDTQVP